MKPIIKDIDKCKHPNSRKTVALARKMKKVRAKEENKLGKYIKQNVIGEKVMWFKENYPDSDRPLTMEQIRELISKYLSRFDEELSQINYKNSIGGKRNRQHTSRESAIQMTLEKELEEYRTCGLEIPDLANTSQVNLLKSWNGELRFLTNFKFKRIVSN